MSELIETGMEPEYNVTDLAWWESVAGGAAVRLCFASRRHGHLVAQYTCVVSLADLEKIRSSHMKLRADLIAEMMLPVEAKAH